MLRPAQEPKAAPQRPGELPSEAPAPFSLPPAVRRKRPGRHWPFALGFAALLALGIGIWEWADPLGEPAISYVTVPVERGDIEDNTTAVGTLQPLEYVDVGTQVSGQLKKFYVELGDHVKEGDLLAELDSTVLQTKVEAGRAQLMSLRAQLEDKRAKHRLAQQQFERQSRLIKDNATSQEAFQSSQAELASAVANIDVLRAQIKTTESNLKADEANLGYTRIMAPMAGTIVSQTAKQGQTLNANQQAPIILRVADLSTMTVSSQVSEADISRLREGMEVYFTTLGSTKRWSSTVRKILPTPEIVNNVVLYNALFDVPNSGGELRTQMTTQVFFVIAKAEKALKVPVAALKPLAQNNGEGTEKQRAEPSGSRANSALQRRLQRGARPADGAGQEKRFRVQVMKADGEIEDREVSVGLMTRVAAEVLSGLEEGEQVVIGTHERKRANGSSGRLQLRLS